LESYGRRAFGLAAIGFGLTYLIWGDFATVWQPVPATAPLHAALVYVGAAAMLIAGGALFFRKAQPLAGFVLALIVGFRPRLAAVGLTAMFAGFSLFVWLPRLLAAPTDHVAWTGNVMNLALVGAAWIVADALSNAQPEPIPAEV
jgi:hypothetical protein